YDLVVIGGGSGGLACSKEAASLGKKVAVLDFVAPSPQGSTWGIGGTCVNVGCIPKKLMHHASLLGDGIKDAKKYGWQLSDQMTFDWGNLVTGVQNYIKSLNWGYRVQLHDKSVRYIPGMASFVDRHTIKAVLKSGKEELLTSEKVVIAVGGRPRFPSDVPGAKEYCITSDDLFSLQKPPGKTLVIGASYVALECAGFLAGFGYNTSLMMRSIPLRGFDQQMASLVTEYMSRHGTRFINQCVPVSVDKRPDGKLHVQWTNPSSGERGEEEFDTVLMAIGRDPSTAALELDKAGVQVDKSGFIIGMENEQTSAKNIYALGDVLQDRPELTPVAIMAGKLLARRLFAGSTIQMDYDNVRILSLRRLLHSINKAAKAEEHAPVRLYSMMSLLTPYWGCTTGDLYTRPSLNPLLGMYYRCGLTMRMLSSTVGIHPTCAEEVVKLHITKRSGEDPTVTGC
ncbi:predicted protein, partial [Nematostella vectensis]